VIVTFDDWLMSTLIECMAAYCKILPLILVDTDCFPTPALKSGTGVETVIDVVLDIQFVVSIMRQSLPFRPNILVSLMYTSMPLKITVTASNIITV